MKKIILFLTLLALVALPLAAQAQPEFKLGGYVKLDSWWDASQEGKNMTTAILRSNNPQFHHGRFYSTAQGSRFNFTIKGPKVWGAQTSGLIEVDFDANADPVGLSSTHSYSPRLRHAMFRLNWPETELMFGQYWSFISEFTPESVQDSGLNYHGTASHRVPQVRLTQKFLGAWTAGIIVAKPEDMADTNFGGGPIPGTGAIGNTPTLNNPGPNSETPQLQLKLAYEQDLWGKAAWFGVPRPFAVQVNAAWQRSRFNQGRFTGVFFGGDNVATTTNATTGAVTTTGSTLYQRDNQTLDNWVVQGNVFIPIIPTYSANLAGTASLSASYFLGQGLEAFGLSRSQDDSHFEFRDFVTSTSFLTDRALTRLWGGWVQGQYYFSNQWFANVGWGYIRTFGLKTAGPFYDVTKLNGYTPDAWNSAAGEPMKDWWEVDATLWYRPIQALKFGIQYSYSRTDWFYKGLPTVLNDVKTGVSSGASLSPVLKSSKDGSDYGDAHRIEFVAFFFF